jgi:hypothetical protein
VDMRIEVDSRAFLRRISHSGTIALQRYNVNVRNDQIRRRHERCSLGRKRCRVYFLLLVLALAGAALVLARIGKWGSA